MTHQRKIFLMATGSALLILVAMTIGTSFLWQRVLHFHAIQLGKQIKSTLVREVSEGNYFGVSATLDRLRMAGIYDRIAVVDTTAKPIQWLYTSDDSLRSDHEESPLLVNCFSDTDDRSFQVDNQLFFSVPLKESSSPNIGLCALVSSELSRELLNLRGLVISIFLAIAIMAIAGLTYLILRLNRQQLEFQKIEGQKQLEKAEALGNLAAQVSHDIRSPLTALNMMVSSISNLPEEQRLILRAAAQRINDIANQLLANSRSRSLSLSPEIGQSDFASTKSDGILVPAVVDLLVSEKRVQFREKPGVRIEFDYSGVYDAFVDFPQKELGRILSNLINNAVEALPAERGEVKISVRAYQSVVQVIVHDNGKGIPENLLTKVGTRGFSFGKVVTQSGSGLGLYHAKTILERHGGRLEFASKGGEGTSVSVTIPRIGAPVWFLRELKLDMDSTVVVVDDDSIIHSVWKKRLEDLTQKNPRVSLLSFSTTKSFQVWLNGNELSQLNLTVLMDYEFLGESETGLDVIESLRLENNSILVTSRYDDPKVQRRASQKRLPIIPKSMAPSIPLFLNQIPLAPDR